jgi:hypothetical protein
MNKPTIGRIVHVHRGASEQAEPAIICFVHSDRLVNVAGFSHNGVPFAATSLQLLQEKDAPPAGHYAEWPVIVAPEKASVTENGGKQAGKS